LESQHPIAEVTAADVVVLARAARLPVETARLDELAASLSTALQATRRLDEPAARVSLSDALDYDPSWDGEGS
jgi:hypothetical protein